MKNVLSKVMEKFNFNFETDMSITDKFARYAFIIVLTIMTYIVTVSTASILITGSMIGGKGESYGSLTVEFFGSEGGMPGVLTNKQKAAVLNILQSTSGVKNVKNITVDEMKNMFVKWMPGVEFPANMPLPTLFSVELSGVNSANVADISNALSTVSKNVRIYDHSAMNGTALKINNMFKMITMFLAILSVVMICAAVYHFTKSSAAANGNTLKVLKMIGAPRGYIARQFKTLNLIVSFKAILFSTAISLITFVLCYSTLYPMNILKYCAICSSLMVVIPVIMLAVIIGISEIAVTITSNYLGCKNEMA